MRRNRSSRSAGRVSETGSALSRREFVAQAGGSIALAACGGLAGVSSSAAAAEIVPGAYYVDPVDGNDSNNGVLEGETGSGPTSTRVAGNGAWKTWEALRSRLAAGTFAPGDHVYLRGGTYVPTFTECRVRNGSQGVTLPEKVTIEGYPGEAVVFQWDTGNGSTSDVGIRNAHQGRPPISCVDGNFRFKGLTIVTQIAAFGTDVSDKPHGLQFIDIRRAKHGSVSTGRGDTGGTIALGNNSNDFLIEAYQTLPGQYENLNSNDNAAEIYYIFCQRGTIRNCLIEWGGANGSCVMSKRGSGVENITYENNLFHRVNYGRCVYGIQASNHKFLNNVFISSGGGGYAVEFSGDLRKWDHTGHRCVFDHNTSLYLGSKVGQGMLMGIHTDVDYTNSAKDGSFTNNALQGVAWHGYRGSSNRQPFAHRLTSDWNQYDDDRAAYQFDSYPSLRRWQRETRYFMSESNPQGSHDLNSVQDTPEFVGADPRDPGSWRITNPHEGGDGNPMGADTSSIGPARLGYAAT